MNIKKPSIQGLNSLSPIPLYRQLADIISKKIRTGEYQPGVAIPSENVLAKTYAIGRPTARQATDTLIRKGMLVRKRGAGTFVRKIAKEVDLFSLGGTMASFEKKGVVIKTDILHPMKLMPISKDAENPFKGEAAYFFSRLSHADGVPVLIEDIYLHAALFSGIDRIDLRGRSLSRAVEEQFYLRPIGGKQTFRIEYPNTMVAEKLAVSIDTPVLAVKRYLHFPQAENAVYSTLLCRTDKFDFSQTIGEVVYEDTGVL